MLATLGALYLLLPLPVIIAVNWSVARRAPDAPEAPVAAVAGTLSLAALAMAALLVASEGLAALGQARPGGAAAQGQLQDPIRYAVLMLATAAVAGAMLLAPVRSWLAGRARVPIDPANPVHTTALVLAVLLLGTQMAAQLSTDVLREVAASSGSRLVPLDLVLQELPFLAAALLGVGLLTRRRGHEALRRLGLVRPAPWQILLALAAAGVLFTFTTGVDAIAHRLTPNLAHEVDAANQHIFGNMSNPGGIATIALSAGICEEALFRGALQPRLGLLWTALLFTAVHTQYGLTLDAVAVFGAAVGLGLIRRFVNTTSSTICHVVYNGIVGVQLVGTTLLLPAIAAEVALLALTSTAWLAERSKRLRAGSIDASRPDGSL